MAPRMLRRSSSGMAPLSLLLNVASLGAGEVGTPQHRSRCARADGDVYMHENPEYPGLSLTDFCAAVASVPERSAAEAGFVRACRARRSRNAWARAVWAGGDVADAPGGFGRGMAGGLAAATANGKNGGRSQKASWLWRQAQLRVDRPYL
jgi:hypothetical protein